MIGLPRIRSVLAATVMLPALLQVSVAAEPVQLITPEEARLPASSPGGIDRNITRGPGIDTLAPSAIGVDGTFRFAVKFKPRNGVEIDPDNVSVTYLREPNVDLTARVKAFISTDGSRFPPSWRLPESMSSSSRRSTGKAARGAAR